MQELSLRRWVCYGCPSAQLDNISYARVIDASNGMYVSVGDVIEALFENNREMYKRAQEMGEGYSSPGDYIFEGLYEMRPGVYNMNGWDIEVEDPN